MWSHFVCVETDNDFDRLEPQCTVVADATNWSSASDANWPAIEEQDKVKVKLQKHEQWDE